MPLVALAVVVAGLGAVLVARARRRGGVGPGGRRVLSTRGRATSATGCSARRAWLGIVLASALVVAGHAVTFLIAARTAGTTAPPSRMLPLALLVLLAMVLPSVGGWGPREG